MHIKLPRVYYFISKFDKNSINKLNKNIALIYRNYNKNLNKNLIIQIKKYCKLQKRKFLLSNNFKLAFKLGLDGVYFPSFNSDLKHLNYPKKKNFFVIGSAHNYQEIKKKELQEVDIKGKGEAEKTSGFGVSYTMGSLSVAAYAGKTENGNGVSTADDEGKGLTLSIAF